MPVVQGAAIPQLRKDKRMAPYVTRYDCADPGHPDRTLKFLYDSARKLIARKREGDYTDALIKPPKVATVQ